MGWWAPVCCGISVHCVLEYLLLDDMGWWAPVCFRDVSNCVLEYLLMDYKYMGWWAPVCCLGVSTLCVVVPPPGLHGVAHTGSLWGVSTPCMLTEL